jgi:hypothetical protein
VHVRDFETFNRVFFFLRDDLGLLNKWGKQWQPGSEAKRMYAGFWAGNMCIEPCGPYPTDKFEGDAKTMFFAITFLPFQSSKASAREFEARGLPHNGQKVFLSVTDPHLSSGSCGVCIMDVSPKNRKEDDALEVKMRQQFAAAQGGHLGLVGVEEILVRYTSDEGRRRWASLLEPFKPEGGSLWKLGKSPSIRLVKSSRTGLEGLVLKVRSLAAAKKALKAAGMLGEAQEGQVQILQEKACGLTILLRE